MNLHSLGGREVGGEVWGEEEGVGGTASGISSDDEVDTEGGDAKRQKTS